MGGTAGNHRNNTDLITYAQWFFFCPVEGTRAHLFQEATGLYWMLLALDTNSLLPWGNLVFWKFAEALQHSVEILFWLGFCFLTFLLRDLLRIAAADSKKNTSSITK